MYFMRAIRIRDGETRRAIVKQNGIYAQTLLQARQMVDWWNGANNHPWQYELIEEPVQTEATLFDDLGFTLGHSPSIRPPL
jgi:hypothetical protein